MKVIYGAITSLPEEEWRSGIYEVGTDGGSPLLLRVAGRRTYPEGGTFMTALFSPTLSPDGTQVAYFEGWGTVATSFES